MKMHKENTVALMIDIQEKLFPLVAERDQLLKRSTILIQGLKIFGIPLIATQQYSRGLGETINDIRSLIKSFSPIDKLAFSCCGEPNFMNKISNTEIENAIVFGIEAHVCVLQTVLDLLDEGYQPIVVEDCVSSRERNDKQIAIARMRHEGAVVTTYESLLFEICEKSGTDRFKALSRLIKDHA
jgi:nicotinamidase-related amidase